LNPSLENVNALANTLKENTQLKEKLLRLEQVERPVTESAIGFKPLLPVTGAYTCDEFERLEIDLKAMREAAKRNKEKVDGYNDLLKSSREMSEELENLKAQELLDNKTIANQVTEIERIKKDVKAKQKEINSLKKMNK